MLVLPAHTTLLQAHEHDYSDTEKVLRIALRFLLQHSAKTPEERNQVDYAGLNEEDMHNPFFESLSNRRWSLTPAQMRALYQKLTDRYVTVLLQHNITLPEEHAVAALFEAPRLVEPGQSYAMRTRPYVDVRGQYIFVTFPHPQYKSRMDALTVRIQEQKQWCRYTSNTEHEWQLPLLPETFGMVLQYFPLPTTELSVRARSYKDILDARLAHSAPTQTADAHTLEYRKLLAAVNNLEGEIAPGVTLYPHQKEVVRAMLWRHYFLCGDETGLGKAQPLDAAILTPHGWKTMGEMHVGVQVIGQDGHAHTVTGVYPQGKKAIYRVTMNDGSTVECCDEHLWTVNTPVRKHRGNPAMTVPLKDIMHRLHDASGKARYHIPMVEPVQFTEKTLPLDAYALGLLLGNGGFRSHTIAFSSSDKETVTRLAKLLPVGMKVRYLEKYDYVITSPEAKDTLRVILQELGLLGHKSTEKFIPALYQFASVASRIALLQGLLDTDAYVGNDQPNGEIPARKGSNIEYSTSSEQLGKDVVALVQSLGGVAYMTSRIPHYTYKNEYREGQKNYRINISLPCTLNPFRLERRKSVYQARTKYQPTRAIVQVEYLGEREAQCIRVNASDHLYVTDNYIVTHNTFPAIVAAKALHVVYGYKLYVVSTKSSLDMWQETAVLFDLPVTVYGWGELLAMKFNEGDTFTEDFTLIADEVHYAKNFKSQRSQKYLEFTGMTHCKAHYGLSGTLSPNGRPVEVYNGLFAVRHPLVYSSSSARANSLKNQYLDRFCNRHRRKIGSNTYVWDVNGASEVPLWNSLVVYTPGSKENHQHACMIARLKTDVTDLPEKRRVMLPVSMSPDATKVFRAAIEKMWKDYNARVEEKVAAYKLKNANAGPDEIAALRARIKKAYALVSAVFLRHAGAIAKVETTLEYARMIASRGSKLVIFTYFTDVAKQVGAQLAAEFGPESVGYILGEMSRDERTAAMRSFQDKTSKTLFIISTSAGGESITLTTAQHMLIIDRTWSVKDVRQWEDRIHRMTTTGIVTIYWLQLPKELTEVDITIDDVLQGKQVVVDLMQFNKVTDGMKFIPITNLKDQAEMLLYAAYMQSMKRKKAAHA